MGSSHAKPLNGGSSVRSRYDKRNEAIKRILEARIAQSSKKS